MGDGAHRGFFRKGRNCGVDLRVREVVGRIDRAIALVDGMNLFNNAKTAFGYEFPNYDVAKLSRAVSAALGCKLVETRFYSGMHSVERNRDRHMFWRAKTDRMRASGVHVFTRMLSYSGEFPEEKGIDMRIGLDAFRLVVREMCDTIIIFSRDQDFTEVKDYVNEFAAEQNRAVRLVSAFPVTKSGPRYGIRGFQSFRISKAMYDACIDHWDYRPRRTRSRAGG